MGYPKSWRNTNFYLTLGVEPTAGSEEISKKHAWMKNKILSDTVLIEDKESELLLLDTAEATLTDVAQREKYNKFLTRVHNFSNINSLKSKDNGIRYIFVSILLAAILPAIYTIYYTVEASATFYNSILSGSNTNSLDLQTTLLADAYFILTLQGLFWLGLLSGPILAGVFGKYKFLGKEGMFALGFKAKWLILALLFGIAAQAVSVGVGYLIQQAYSEESISGNAATVAEAFQGLNPLLIFVMLAIVAPIVEEIFYRGLVFTALANRFGILSGGIISSLAFGISHYQGAGYNGLFVVALTASLGGILAYARYKSGGLFLPIMIHVFFNAVSASILIFAGDTLLSQ